MLTAVTNEASLRQAIGEAASRDYDVLATLGGNSASAAFLARKRKGGSLGVLMVEGGSPDATPRTLRWKTVDDAGVALPLGSSTCLRCGKPTAAPGAACPSCGESGTRNTDAALSDAALRAIQEEIQRKYGPSFRLQGAVPIGADGAKLLLATDATGTTIGFEIESLSPDSEEMTLTESWRGARIPAEFFANRIFTGVEPPPPEARTKRRVSPWIALLLAVPMVAALLLVASHRADTGGQLASSERRADPTRESASTTVSGGEGAASPDQPPPVRSSPGGAARAAPSSPPTVPTAGPPPEPVPVQPAAGGVDIGTTKVSGRESPLARPTAPAAEGGSAEDRVMAAVDAYVRAIESRDIARLRRAYPGITPAEVSRWDAQFAQMRDAGGVQASSRVERGPEVSGDVATVIFTLTLQYREPDGEQRTIPMPVRAVLTREKTGWRLSEVLALY